MAYLRGIFYLGLTEMERVNSRWTVPYHGLGSGTTEKGCCTDTSIYRPMLPNCGYMCLAPQTPAPMTSRFWTLIRSEHFLLFLYCFYWIFETTPINTNTLTKLEDLNVIPKISMVVSVVITMLRREIEVDSWDWLTS